MSDIKPGLLRSYLFFAIELKGDNYARGKLTDIARQINRVFPMPVMVIIKHRVQKQPVISIAVINRRQNKVDAAKDVLGKVTIIRDISIAQPHRGHKDILNSFALETLREEQRQPIESFDALHAAWEEIFNVELLNKSFYRELSNWYLWAKPQVEFPADVEPDKEKRNATALIRLLTRLIFCWFLKEKGLIPERLFNETDLKGILTELKPDSSSYYQTILQNLFFGTLNQKMGTNPKTKKSWRQFAKDEGYPKNKKNDRVNNLFRYEDQFADGEDAIEHFADIPFLNGGLFECLDRDLGKTNKKIHIDGFSRNKKNRPSVSNKLFFTDWQTVDLSGTEAYGERSRRSEKVRGLIRILNSYKFTIVENTPIEQEIALDPELLGKVFENLLASYNEETRTSARKQTGSFYTPRPIVDYMVDESLKAHLLTPLVEVGMKADDAKSGLEKLLAYTEQPQPFNDSQVNTLLDAIHTCKILDPACGSGAFPMGMLQKLVYIIHKLDRENTKWMRLQVNKAKNNTDPVERDAAIKAIEQDFKDNEEDYGRKLYLIENCLYGVDIQPIAIQISKLRFFISLVCDQKTNRRKKDNHGIRPLPNLETKFVAADTLAPLKRDLAQAEFQDVKTLKLEKQLQKVRHDYFGVTSRKRKLSLRAKDRKIREELAKELQQTGFWDQANAKKLADWSPYDPQITSDYFEPLWMFDQTVADGFDIVIGNPPYVFGGNKGISEDAKKRFKQLYVSGSGKINLFAIFIERGSNLLRKNGYLSYILPNTLLRVTSYKRIRKFILEEMLVDEIVDLDVGVFDKVTASTITLRIRNVKPDCNSKARLRHGLDDRSDKTFTQIDWVRAGYIIDIFSSEGDRAILDSIERDSEPLGILSDRIRFGVVISGNFDDVVCKQKLGSNWHPFLEGNEIGPFIINYSDRFLNYEPGLLHRARTPDIFECKKLMLMRITGGQMPLKAAIDTFGFYNKESILNVILKSQHAAIYEFVAAVINSSLGNWFYRKKFTNDSKLTVNLSKEYVGQIPIRMVDKSISRLFSKIVELLSFSTKHGRVEAGFLYDLIDACVSLLIKVAQLVRCCLAKGMVPSSNLPKTMIAY